MLVAEKQTGKYFRKKKAAAISGVPYWILICVVKQGIIADKETFRLKIGSCYMKNGKQKISKGRKIAACVLLFICAVFILYCAAVMIYRLATVTEAKRFSAVTRFLAEFGITCLLSVPAVDLGSGLFTWKKNRALKAAGISLRFLSCGVCAVFVALCAAVVVTGMIADDKKVNDVCVLGLAIDGDEMHPDLINRLDRAVEYGDAHPDVRFIATGGNSDDPYYSEAEQMARYLETKGIKKDAGKLVTETRARTTVENFLYSAEIVDKNAPLGVVTSNVHMFRATGIAKKQGYTDIVKIPARSVAVFYPENVMWEMICSFFEILGGEMAL